MNLYNNNNHTFIPITRVIAPISPFQRFNLVPIKTSFSKNNNKQQKITKLTENTTSDSIKTQQNDEDLTVRVKLDLVQQIEQE